MNSTQLIRLARGKEAVNLERLNKRNHSKLSNDLMVDLIAAFDVMLKNKNQIKWE